MKRARLDESGSIVQFPAQYRCDTAFLVVSCLGIS
jgi:hypothetical protein